MSQSALYNFLHSPLYPCLAQYFHCVLAMHTIMYDKNKVQCFKLNTVV